MQIFSFFVEGINVKKNQNIDIQNKKRLGEPKAERLRHIDDSICYSPTSSASANHSHAAGWRVPTLVAMRKVADVTNEPSPAKIQLIGKLRYNGHCHCGATTDSSQSNIRDYGEIGQVKPFILTSRSIRFPF